MNKILKKGGKISNHFINRGILTFEDAAEFVRNLPYRRNKNKENIFCVLEDEGGTCSSKHALLKRMTDENNVPDVKLMLGIIRMNSQNTPKITSVLQKYDLTEMPEAHNYLKIKEKIYDFTSRNSKPEDFIKDLITETEISPEQITTFKIQYHQNLLENYLVAHPEIRYSNEKFWQIREECIAALQQ